MRKITILLVINLFCVNLINSQIVSFEFNATPYLDASFINPNINVSSILLSSGTISTNVRTGDYFTDEPYIEESGGWSRTDLAEAKYFYINITVNSGYRFSISNFAFDAYVTSAGPSAVTVLFDEVSAYNNSMQDGVLQEINQPVSGYSGLTQITLKIVGWDNGSRATSGSGAFRIDNLIIDGFVEEIPPNDSSSFIQATSFLVPQRISSVLNDSFLQVAEFIIADSASGDGVSTFVDSIIFTAGESNNITDWTSILSNILLINNDFNDTIEGTIKNNSVFFKTSEGYEVEEGLANSDTCKLLIRLKPELTGFDNTSFEFVLDSANVYCNAAGSKVGWGNISTGNNNLTIQVEATTLNAIIETKVIWKDSLFNISITAVDYNGNIDTDINSNFELVLADGTGVLQSQESLSGNFYQGEASLQNLIFTGSDTLLLKLETSNFKDYLFDEILVAKPLFYDDLETANLSLWKNIDDWEASSLEPINGDFSIKHNLSDTGGFSYLTAKHFAPTMNNGKVVWRMIIKNGNFDPTSTNKFWYYLMASNENFASESNYGYVVGVNFLGSNDSLSLWKLDEYGEKSLILQSAFNWNENDTVAIEVIREVPGLWQIGFSESSKYEDFIYTPKVKDNSYCNLPFHGLSYQYSITRAGLLWCDDLWFGQLNTPPQLISASGISNDTILLIFSEPIDIDEVENIENYKLNSLTDSLATIRKAHYNSELSDTVYLIVNSLKTADYSITVSGLSDLDGAVMKSDTFLFSYSVPAVLHDIVFTEVMFDASPSVGLPEADYLEIYNRSSNVLKLDGWLIDIGGTVKTFPEIALGANEYLIVTSSTYSDEFLVYGDVVGVINSNSLTNSGKYVVLYSQNGDMIDSLFYNPDWIVDEQKQDGGWSLERIDTENLCSTDKNWNESIDENGGTPGFENSVIRSNIDNLPPEIIYFKTAGENAIYLEFSESVDVFLVLNVDNYSFNIHSNSIDSVKFIDNSFTSLMLYSDLPFNQGENYLLQIENIGDLCGNILQDTAIEFVFNYIEQNDIVFSEIMIDPSPIVGLPDYEYVELYNRSIKTIDLENWQLIINETIRLLPRVTLLPDSFVVILSNSALNEFNFVSNKLGISSLPTLRNQSGVIMLVDTLSQLVNSIEYNDTWYQDNEKDAGGWSLEIIDPNNQCGGVNNWKASASIFGGTPGETNSVNAKNMDKISPEIVQAFPVNRNTFILKFTEQINSNIVTNSNFNIKDLGIAESFSFDSIDKSVSVLQFNNEFTQNKNYEISITNIFDNCGNRLKDTVITFVHHKVELYDIVINEIMANPEPSAGLPEVEFIEIYNNSDYEIFGYGWSINIGSSNRELPWLKIAAQSYLVLYDDEILQPFNGEQFLSQEINLPSLPLSGFIQILDSDSKLICQTEYSSSWFADDFKADGGYSLERIDYNNPDESEQNWLQSNDDLGGTPGKINSVYANNSDVTPPDLVSAYPVNDTLISIEFSESIRFYDIQVDDIIVKNEDNIIHSLAIKNNDLSRVYLVLNRSLQSGVEYTIQVNSVTDIAGNSILNNTVTVALPVKASPNDIVINELLWNPFDGGVDFVELYNRSAFPVNLDQFLLATFDEDGNIKSPQKITNYGALLFPEKYMVISENKDIVKQQYFTENNFSFVDISSLPTLPNGSGSVVIIDTNGVVIDYLYYSDNMHFGLLNDTKGVSLERVNFNRPSQELSNWHSAAEKSGWATPGYKNSMFNEQSETEGQIILESDTFSPDNDGYKDVLYLKYSFDEPGYVANVVIFDVKGRLIKTITENELLGTEGVLAWDGLTDSKQKASIGIYIIFFEIFNLDGEVVKFKRVCAINARFD